MANRSEGSFLWTLLKYMFLSAVLFVAIDLYTNKGYPGNLFVI